MVKHSHLVLTVIVTQAHTNTKQQFCSLSFHQHIQFLTRERDSYCRERQTGLVSVFNGWVDAECVREGEEEEEGELRLNKDSYSSCVFVCVFLCLSLFVWIYYG